MSETFDPKTDPQRKTILVIDDDKPTCALFKVLLNRDGFDVEMAYSGEEALNLLKTDAYSQYDLVVLDLMMPRYSGYEVLKELQQPGYQEVPIFVATAHMLDQGTVDLINTESNIKGFWNKPLDSKLFRDRVHKLLGTVPRPKTTA